MDEPVSMRLAAPQQENEEQPTLQQSVKIYPNPAKYRFIVQLPEGERNGMLELFDLSGRKVFEQKLQSGISEIHTTFFAETMYIYTIRCDSGITSRGRIVFQK